MSDWPPAEPPPPAPGPPGPGWWLASDGNYYPPQQPPPPAQYTAYAPYGAPAVQTATNGLAIASMVLGILWIYWIGSVLALVFGYIAKGQIDKSAGRQSGRGMAIAGIVLGWIGVATLVLVIAVAVLARNSSSSFDINSDPADGYCNEARYVQDPDC